MHCVAAPREDLRGFVGMRKVSSVELKKKLSNHLVGNAEGLGQLIRYGARDCQQGDYITILTSLRYFLFARISYISSDEVSGFVLYPPFSHLLNVMMVDLDLADTESTKLQHILPFQTPVIFTLLTRFIDRMCTLHHAPITFPRFFLLSDGVEKEWIVNNPRVLQQTARSLTIGADHWEEGAAAGVVIKIAGEESLRREEFIHSLVDGRIMNIRKMVGRVKIEAVASGLMHGVVLSPLVIHWHRFLLAILIRSCFAHIKLYQNYTGCQFFIEM